jgi:hypothetical protein
MLDGFWAALAQPSSHPLIVWESIPDFSQLPALSNASAGADYSLLTVQSSSCRTPCAASGICTSSGTCDCPHNFQGGPSCEQCTSGFFGPTCESMQYFTFHVPHYMQLIIIAICDLECPAGCPHCDDGISGTGICVNHTQQNPPWFCNCSMGYCDSSGKCTCLPGWATDTTFQSKQCGTCAKGFFLTESGRCAPCGQGCAQCTDISGACTACEHGLDYMIGNPATCTSPPPCDFGYIDSSGKCAQYVDPA